MKKPSGAQNRKVKKKKVELEKSFNLLGEIPCHLKNIGNNINDDLKHHAKYRESGYSTEKILACNVTKKQEREQKIARIKSQYSASDYPSKKAMYLDIAQKENIKPRTAMDYMNA